MNPLFFINHESFTNLSGFPPNRRRLCDVPPNFRPSKPTQNLPFEIWQKHILSRLTCDDLAALEEAQSDLWRDDLEFLQYRVKRVEEERRRQTELATFYRDLYTVNAWKVRLGFFCFVRLSLDSSPMFCSLHLPSKPTASNST